MDELNLNWKQVWFILLLAGITLLVIGVYSVGYKIGLEKATEQCETYKAMHCNPLMNYLTLEKMDIEIKEKIKI